MARTRRRRSSLGRGRVMILAYCGAQIKYCTSPVVGAQSPPGGSSGRAMRATAPEGFMGSRDERRSNGRQAMKARVKWVEGVSFVGETGSGHAMVIDGAPEHGGRNLGARPMELVLTGAAACTAFDVVLILQEGAPADRRLRRRGRSGSAPPSSRRSSPASTSSTTSPAAASTRTRSSARSSCRRKNTARRR